MCVCVYIYVENTYIYTPPTCVCVCVFRILLKYIQYFRVVLLRVLKKIKQLLEFPATYKDVGLNF